MRRAFTLIDAISTLVVAAILLAIVFASLSESRRNARLGEDIDSLKRFAAGTSQYAADNEGALWTFSWKGGETYLMMDINGDLVPTVMPDDDVNASAHQAVHIIRSLGGRIGPNGMPIVDNWVAPVFYSHLPLQDYLRDDPLSRWTTSAADEVKQNWKDDPENKFDQGEWLPLQPEPTPSGKRWPYSAGFQLSPAVWDYNQSELGAEFNALRVQQGGSQNFYSLPGEVHLGDRVLADVVHPGAKAQVYDVHQRHFGPKQYYVGVDSSDAGAEALARVPVLLVDGSADVRASRDANPGWRPQTPTFPCMTFWYSPNAWDPETTDGEPLQFSKGFFRWTRGGLKGVDFGANPIDTGQAAPGECNL